LSDGSIQNLAVHLGFVEVGADHVTILSDSAELEEDIDVARAKAAKERAETQLRTEHSTEVEADLRRAHARLSASGGLGSSH
jgi:F-type H+-transporting ATPase subunit epsilon